MFYLSLFSLSIFSALLLLLVLGVDSNISLIINHSRSVCQLMGQNLDFLVLPSPDQRNMKQQSEEES